MGRRKRYKRTKLGDEQRRDRERALLLLGATRLQAIRGSESFDAYKRLKHRLLYR